MKVFESKKELLVFLESKKVLKQVDSNDMDMLNEWIDNDCGLLLISDNESCDYLKDYILDDDMLCCFNTSVIVSNLKPEFVTMPERVIDILKEKFDNESLKALINMDHFITEVLRYDGLAHIINGYDGCSIELYYDDDIQYIIAI